MRTAIISDLHLGSSFGEDLLRDPGVRETLLAEIAGAERLVLLGDFLELREDPLATVLERARPFVEELGEAMSGRQVVLVPGNHDHRLAEPLLDELAGGGGALGLESHGAPAGAAATRIAEWLGDAELQISYPGIWLRGDVYATHGHYMDAHMSLPRLECLGAATSIRAFGPLPPTTGPEDYERILRPIYALSYSLAQARVARRVTRPSESAWRVVSGRRRPSGRARRALVGAAVGAGIPATIWGLNKALRADFDPELSAATISRSGISAAAELTTRMRIGAAHVITGHTHRAGPDEGGSAWEAGDGTLLHNTGSWVFASAFHHPGTPPGPYWPGTVTWLDEEGPPRRVRLLLERPREELRTAVSRIAASH